MSRSSNNFTNEQPNGQPNIPALEHPVVRHRVPHNSLIASTTDTRTVDLTVDTYRHLTEHWIKVNAFYDCRCGRYIGFYFQQPLEIPPPPQVQPVRVVDLTTPPPARPNETVITISSGNDSVVSIASSESSSLLTELYREPANFDDQYDPRTNVSSSSVSDNQSVEPMSLDISPPTNEV